MGVGGHADEGEDRSADAGEIWGGSGVEDARAPAFCGLTTGNKQSLATRRPGKGGGLQVILHRDAFAIGHWSLRIPT